MKLRKLLRVAFSVNSDRTALVSPEKNLTYAELEDEVKKYAAAMDRMCLEDDRVIVSSPNSPEMLKAVLACWYSGRTCVHLNPRIEEEEIPYYLKDADPGAVIHHPALAEKFRDAEAEKLSLDRELPEKGSAETYSPDYISLTYTSGTTGRPKGVPYRDERLVHGTIVLVLEALDAWNEKAGPLEDELDARNSRDRDRTESFPDKKIEEFVEHRPLEGAKHGIIYPLYHVSGSNPSLATLVGGGTVVLPGSRKPGDVAECIEDEEIEMIGGVPTQLKDLSETVAERSTDVSSLRYVHTAGGMLTPGTAEQVRENLSENLCHEYASSETLEMTYNLDKKHCIGRATPLQDLRVVEPGGDPGETVDEGDIGEMIVNTNGPTVFSGYWNKPRKTEEAINSGWYYTGDLVRKDSEEDYHIKGRADDMIVSGGENIAPGEVEKAIEEHPDTRVAGVMGVEDDRWGSKVVAFIEGDIDEEKLDSFLKESALADFKRPKEYIFLEEVPTKETSGVDRKEFEKRYDLR